MEPRLIDPRQRRLAERRLVHALQRLHQREPMKPDFRVDAVLAVVRSVPRAAPGHRGAARLELDDPALLEVVDGLVARGALARRGHRVRLPDHKVRLDAQLRERVERLLDGLREAGAEPPRVDGIAARLGITPVALDQLRSSGELVQVAPGIDYPRDVWDSLRTQVDRLSRAGPMNVGRLRDELRTSRRHAEAILAFRRAERRRGGRQVGRGLRPERRGG
jgi:hypothetical protein